MILCITGPSGSGKTTIANILAKFDYPEIVSTTTRQMREGEINGKSYYFVTMEDFSMLDKIEESFYAGNSYGLTRKEVENKMRDYDVCVFVSDINGIRKLKEMYPDDTVSVFLDVTLDEMKERMTKRGDSLQNVEKRIKHAVQNEELQNGQFCDYKVRNEYLSVATGLILEIIEHNQKKEKIS